MAKRITEGSDITKRSWLSVSTQSTDPKDLEIMSKWMKSLSGRDFSHEGRIKSIESWAERVLDDAGFPSDPSRRYDPSTGEPIGVESDRLGAGLPGLVSPRGKWPKRKLEIYPFDSREGFAAEILMRIHDYRMFWNRGDTNDALITHADLWRTIGQMNAKFALQAFRRKGSRARKSKVKLGIQQAVNELTENSPDKSTQWLWQKLKREEYDTDVVATDGQRYNVYFDVDRLYQANYIQGVRSIGNRAFERYVRRAKEMLQKMRVADEDQMLSLKE